MKGLFTDRARKVLDLAHQEAVRTSSGFIGTEHLLVGLIAEGSGVAANVLKNWQITLDSLREHIKPSANNDTWSLDIPKGTVEQSPKVKKAIEAAIKEADELKHNYIGTEHLLLGLLDVERTFALQIIKDLGVSANDIREDVLNLLGFPKEDENNTSLLKENERLEYIVEEYKKLIGNIMFEIKNGGTNANIIELIEEFSQKNIYCENGQ